MIETHPLTPLLPSHARVLLLGGFVPPSKRFAMPFFYPNINNDMWRIIGQVFFADRHHFLGDGGYHMPLLVDFLHRQGIGVADMAQQVYRQHGNAADRFLQVETLTDIDGVLTQLPQCRYVLATGKLAAELLFERIGVTTPVPAMGEEMALNLQGRVIDFYRLPSSSRAYPLAFADKVAFYRRAFVAAFGASLSDNQQSPVHGR